MKKRAVLCLLRLYRKSPETIDAAEMCGRFVALLDNLDQGVVNAAVGLLLGIVSGRVCVRKERKSLPHSHFPFIFILRRVAAANESDTSAWAACIPKTIKALAKLLSADNRDPAYAYHGLANPWLAVVRRDINNP